MGKITETIKHLIIINILFFIGSKMIGDTAFNLLSLSYPQSDNFKIWQIVTSMFMHSSNFHFHIIMNMFGLYMFGSPLEQMWGRNKFLFFYFSTGIGAVVFSYTIDYIQFNNIINEITGSLNTSSTEILTLLNERKYDTRWQEVITLDKFDRLNQIFYGQSLGASGAIMGLIAAFGYSFPNAKMGLIFLPIPIAAKYFIPVILAYEIYSGIAGGQSIFGVNIAHFVHVGGALTGFIIAWYWKRNQFKQWN